MSSDEEPVFMTFDWGSELRDERAGRGSFGRIDALGKPVPGKGPIRVWQDHDVDGSPAPEGWVHVPGPRDVIKKLLGGRVIEISVGNDFVEESGHGSGVEVVNWIHHTYKYHRLLLWPRDGLRDRSKKPEAIEALRQEIELLAETGKVTLVGEPDAAGSLYYTTVAKPDKSKAPEG